MVALRSSPSLISREGDLLTLQGLLTLSALPTSLDDTLLSPPMWLLGSCQLLMTSSQRSDIF